MRESLSPEERTTLTEAAVLRFARAMPASLLFFTRPGQAFLYHVFHRYWCPGGGGTVRNCIRRGDCGCNNGDRR